MVMIDREALRQEALRVHAHEYIFTVSDGTFHQRVMRFVSENDLKSDDLEIAVRR